MKYEVNESGEILKNHSDKNNAWSIIAIISIIGVIGFAIAYFDASQSNDGYRRRNYNLQSDYNKLNNEINSLQLKYDNEKEKNQKVSKQYPILIESLDFKSGKYPNTFKTQFAKYDITYLYPRLKFTNLTNNDKLVLYVKYYSPDAILATYPKSPYGYTQKVEITMSESTDSYILTGFGNKNGGTYKVGRNKCQIWYNDRILFEKEFNVYQ